MKTCLLRRAVLAEGIVAVLSIVAMLLYPGGTARSAITSGYSFFHNSLSDLGATVARNGQPNGPAAIIFMVGVVLATIVGVACIRTFVPAYSPSRPAMFFSRGAAVFGAISALGLIGIALSPENRSPVAHARFALLGFHSLWFTTLLFGAATLLDRRHRRRVPAAWLVVTLVIMTWAFAMPWQLDTDRALLIQVTLQKLVTIALLIVFPVQLFEIERVASVNRWPSPLIS